MLSNRQSLKWAVTAVGVVAAMMLASAAAQADIINVPGDQPTIQAGIDAAINGDEVVVADGPYTGSGNVNLDFGGRLITVRSASGDPVLCIIDCQSAPQTRGFLFQSGETAAAMVDGFTIANGNVNNNGGGMLIDNSSPTITNCLFLDNLAGSEGGAIVNTSSSPMVMNCSFNDNLAHFGGAD